MSETIDETSSAPAEAKAAAVEFLKNFNTFQDDLSKRMTEMTNRIDALGVKSHEIRRPALEARAAEGMPHQKAFAAYVRQGDEGALRALDLGTKGLNTAVAADGGYLIDPRTAAQVESVLRSGGSLRAIARVVQVEAGAYDVLVDHAELGAGWIDEVAAVGETGGPAFERISIPLHELSASPRASQRILEDAAFDIELWLAERIADRFKRAESAAFVSGDGVNKPKGFLTKPMVANATWSWGSIGYVATGTAGGFDLNDPADALVDLVYALGAEYRANAAFVMNSKTAGEVRKMKDSQGRFMWVEGLSVEHPARLMGYPVTIVEDMPDIAADSFALAFGDFGHGYTVAERPDIRILRDPFSAKPNVSFFATKRVGGDVTDFAAIKTLKFGLS
ncbi:MAG: phage major capsid protein [Thermohalobaculum sp.]|nr:phage major capsid protein [Thermohalobaculum sp.]